jgi:hypothetical protein
MVVTAGGVCGLDGGWAGDGDGIWDQGWRPREAWGLSHPEDAREADQYVRVQPRPASTLSTDGAWRSSAESVPENHSAPQGHSCAVPLKSREKYQSFSQLVRSSVLLSSRIPFCLGCFCLHGGVFDLRFVCRFRFYRELGWMSWAGPLWIICTRWCCRQTARGVTPQGFAWGEVGNRARFLLRFLFFRTSTPSCTDHLKNYPNWCTYHWLICLHELLLIMFWILRPYLIRI